MSDLLLDLPASAAPGSTRAIDTALREAIRSGRLRGGTRLPSTRALSAQLGVARSTVVGVYEQLVAEGFLVSRRGSGTTVSDVHVPVEQPADEAPGATAFGSTSSRVSLTVAHSRAPNGWRRCAA